MDPTLSDAIELKPGDKVEILVADSSLARAFFEGIPVARLLGRARLASDERDVSLSASGAAFESSWDALLRRLLGTSRSRDRSAAEQASAAMQAAREQVKRAVARHTRVAFDEGPLPASDAIVATLVFALASSADPDASLAEIFPLRPASATRVKVDAPPARAVEVAGEQRAPVDQAIVRACAAFDARLAVPGAAGPRIAAYEACVRLAALAVLGPLPWERLRAAAVKLSAPSLATTLLRTSSGSLFPPPADDAQPAPQRRMTQLERAELDALVAKDPRELGSALARLDVNAEHVSVGAGPGSHLDSLVADLKGLLAHTGTLVLAVPPIDPAPVDAGGREGPPSDPRASWVPLDWYAPDAAAALADALERGTATIPRARAIVQSGGEPALDAVGAEMLHVTAHPFASAAFAELLARSGRPRDVMRLVTYFAIAPDPQPAARALSACEAAELPRVLQAWLEAMLPTDGEPALLSDDDPERSSAARVTACVAALKPYPQLYRAVRPLLSRVSDAPPAPGG